MFIRYATVCGSSAAGTEGGEEAAFQANTTTLWVYNTANNSRANTTLGMAAATSPSIG